MGEAPRPEEEQPKKDWSHINKLYDKFKGEQESKIGKEKPPSVAGKVLAGEDVEGLSKDRQEMLKNQLEEEKELNEQRQKEELRNAYEDFEKKWGK
jgi:hypothetical protein